MRYIVIFRPILPIIRKQSTPGDIIFHMRRFFIAHKAHQDLAFFILTSFLATFFLAAAFEKRFDLALLFGFFIAAIALFYGLFINYRTSDQPKNTASNLTDITATVIASVVGALATYFLSNHLKLGPVLSASLVGVA